MTGGEIIPGVVASAGKVAKSTLDEDESMKGKLVELASEMPEIERAAKHYARRVEIRQAVLTKLYAPLAKWVGQSADYFAEGGQFASDMAERTAEIPEENLVSPPPSIAVPAMQGLSYSVDEPALKDMYLNLLAAATDDRRKDQAHPSFAEVIKQLSSDEAKTLDALLSRDAWPLVTVKRQAPNGDGYNFVCRNLIGLSPPFASRDHHIPSIELWVDNWSRLGLLQADFMNFMTDPRAYDWTSTHPAVLRANSGDGLPVEFDKGVLMRTKFGLRFAFAVGALPKKPQPKVPPKGGGATP